MNDAAHARCDSEHYPTGRDLCGLSEPSFAKLQRLAEWTGKPVRVRIEVTGPIERTAVSAGETQP